ncbi:MAG: hypothetical protein HY718_16570, partial [Planctomycetes bacterium]|nr:hypothetical protein [Planctomycetota bacterium]
MFRPLGPILGCVLFFLVPASALAQGTFFLKEYKAETVTSAGFVEQQARWLTRVEKPEELKGLPANIGRRIYFYTGTIGERNVIAVIESGRSRQLYVDLDGDSDLADEKPVPAKRARSSLGWGWSESYRFGPLTFAALPRRAADAAVARDVPAAGRARAAPPRREPAEPAAGDSPDATRSGDEKSDDAQVFAGSFYAEQFDLDYLLIRPALIRRGTLRIGEKSYATVLTDANYNG